MADKKISFSLAEAKKFLNKRGLELFKKNNQIKNDNTFKSFYHTILCSFIVIICFFLSPKIVHFQENILLKSGEVKNNSKINLEKVLSGKFVEKENNENSDLSSVFDDIIITDTLPSDTIRLSAVTIQQLFKDTKYNLENIRKTKLVKPVSLPHLPTEIKMIQNSKDRKKLFIQIVLPLILEENRKIRLDRIKLFSILNKNKNSKDEKKWLKKKFKQYGIKNKDVVTLKIRLDEIPVSLVIAQAAKETGWGTSRFAQEGNALFGQWTYSGEGIKPKAIDNDKTHKIMKFKILKASVRAYQRNLNTHSSYKMFRSVRAELRDNDQKLDSLILADFLDKYAQTGVEYTKTLKKIIKQNSLKDFDDVKLLPSSMREKNLI